MAALENEAPPPVEPEAQPEAEPDAEPGGQPEEVPAEGEPEPEAEPEQEPAPESHGHSEQWWEKAWKAAEREDERHAKRVGEIFEEEAQAFAQCPLCLAGPAGWLTSSQFAPEQVTAVQRVIGMEPEPEYKPAPGAALCTTCDGWGKVRTPSHVQDQTVLVCADCGGYGWKPVQGPQGTTYAPPPSPTLTAVPPPVEALPELPDFWGRPPGHPHYNKPPAEVGV